MICKIWADLPAGRSIEVPLALRNIDILENSSAWGEKYLHAGADCIERQFNDKGQRFRYAWNEEGKNQFDLLVSGQTVDQSGCWTHEILIDIYVEGGGDKRVGESQSDSPVESCAFLFEGLPDKAGSTNFKFLFIALETGGNGVDGVEEDVAQPAEQSRG